MLGAAGGAVNQPAPLVACKYLGVLMLLLVEGLAVTFFLLPLMYNPQGATGAKRSRPGEAPEDPQPPGHLGYAAGVSTGAAGHSGQVGDASGLVTQLVCIVQKVYSK
jgi:hypothetical protein